MKLVPKLIKDSFYEQLWIHFFQRTLFSLFHYIKSIALQFSNLMLYTFLSSDVAVCELSELSIYGHKYLNEMYILLFIPDR